MKRIFTLGITLFAILQTSSAQGVKQLWYLDYWNNKLQSTDTSANLQSTRWEFETTNPGEVAYLGDITLHNGKIYGVNSGTWLLYSYDPMNIINEFSGIIPIDPWDVMSLSPTSGITIVGNKLYGLASITNLTTGAATGYYLFEWDLTTQTITKSNQLPIEPRGRMTAKDGKLYGMTTESIYEWDPEANTVTIKVDFGEKVNSVYESEKRNLILFDGKLYGTTGGPYSPEQTPTIFEWDGSTSEVQTAYSFTSQEAGFYPIGSLIEKNGKLYGVATTEAANLVDGIIFEWDTNPTGTGFQKKIDFSNADYLAPGYFTLLNDNFYGVTIATNGSGYFLYQWNPQTNIFSIKPTPMVVGSSTSTLHYLSLQAIPAPVSLFTAGSCTDFPEVTIDASNNNSWVAVTDSKGDVLAEIMANGNSLGMLNTQAYISSGAIRKDGQGHPYLDRNITITPQNTSIINPVQLRLYITKAEFEALKAEPGSGITDINDLAIFKNEDACSGTITNALPLATTYEDYEFGYVLKASVSSFSTFYFSSRTFEALPLQFISFSAAQKGNDALLQWVTDNEINTKDFSIERSTDGVHFTGIGKVAAKNTSGKHNYSFTDKNITDLSAAVVYYRLKQADLDGKFDYSKTVSIQLSGMVFSVSPNPASGVITVNYKKKTGNATITLQVMDVSGKKVLEQKLNNQTIAHKINISSLAKGVYMISVIDNGERVTTRFIKH